ncbi:PspC domain-containing protein [Arthrobacter psychrolactophilus]
MNISHGASDQPTGPASDPDSTEQQAPTAPPPPLPPTAESSRFFQWIRGLGIQRGSERWVGGVCSGLGNKWGIDPIIVRGLAVVLTLFFGVGLLAYGVAWALLPEPDGRIHVEEVGHGRWSSGMTGATIVTLLGMIGPGQGFVFGMRPQRFPLATALVSPHRLDHLPRHESRKAQPYFSAGSRRGWLRTGGFRDATAVHPRSSHVRQANTRARHSTIWRRSHTLDLRISRHCWFRGTAA